MQVLRQAFHNKQRKEKQMLTKLRSRKGFTLIELLIVVAIIGILAAIAIPQFSAYRVKAYNSAATSDLRNLKTALEQWYNGGNSKYPDPT
jgi:type IV pilus assembly protein PilA